MPALLLAVIACLLGAAGVALAAASTHVGGGDLGHTASEFLILHAAALLGVSAHARNLAKGSRAVLTAGAGLALGTLLFSGDLGLRAFEGVKLFAFAAPIGGSLMILSWVALAIGFALAR